MPSDSPTPDGRSGNPAGRPVAPLPSSPAVRDRFRRQRARDTAPELALRRLLHARGLRYRVDFAPLPGLRRRADVVFTRARIAVFVDGCFWHRCPQHATEPKNNALWWQVKLERNVQRDRDTDAVLAAAGWLVLRVWEHEDAASAADRVLTAWTTRLPAVRPVLSGELGPAGLESDLTRPTSSRLTSSRRAAPPRLLG